MDNASVINVTGQAQIKVIRDVFTSKADYGVKAAYLLWHSVAAASDRFFSDGNRLDLKGFERCMRRAASIGDLWQRLKEEMFSSLERDAEVTASFAAVKKAVLQDVESSILLDFNDVTRFTRLLADISVTTAAADATMRRRVEVPTASPDFSENILHGEEYSFAISESRNPTSSRESLFDESFSTDVVTASSGRGQLGVSLELYLSTQPTSASSNIANMPVLGYELARSIWKGILRNKHWNAKTKENLRSFKNCFRKKITKNMLIWEDEDDEIAAALAMASILKAFQRPADWYTPKSAWSLWYLSHAQFFHISVGVRRCRMMSKYPPGINRAWLMAIPFKYVDDFSEAFNCTTDSDMAVVRAQCRIAAQITTPIDFMVTPFYNTT
ncbi:hypothetical protein HPB48_014422 [Haemaphysalis longicornis]|uniref:Uncharacterized protein n=1 Tax=Haemaphysalis longicornis TaxID=44386 RepID=A0A9J6GY01_HAELO|nr:hypothetical protein HPB48_014422 [Haemaphysalis longicornis]